MNQDENKNFKTLAFASAPRIMIVEARFYDDIGDMLIRGAMDVLKNNGAIYERFTVPGALEIPAAVEMGVRAARFDAFVALGCVIRGGTTHYEIVAGESSRALMDLSVRHALCLGNGILTVENKAQALERADASRLNKGGGAAQAALEMLVLKQALLPLS